MRMKKTRYIVLLCALMMRLMPLPAQDPFETQMEQYASQYPQTDDTQQRLQLANDFFAFLLSEEYIDEAIVFPPDAHIDSVDVNVYYYIAEWYYINGDYNSAVLYCEQAVRCMVGEGEQDRAVDEESKSDVYSLLGAVYFRKSDYVHAVETLNKAYELDRESGDYDRMSSTLNGIASVFTAAGKPEEAEKYILEAIAANSQTTNLRRRSLLFGTASEIYRNMGNYKQSLAYAKQALELERHQGDSVRIGVRLSQVASAEIALGMSQEATASLTEAIPLLLKGGNSHSWGICMNQMGDILANEGKEPEAAEYYTQAMTLFERQGDKYNEMHAREGLYRVLRSSSPQEAMVHLERAKELQDSIYHHETGESIGKYNAIYHNDQLLREKEQSERRKRMTITTIIGLAVPLLLLLAFALYITFRRQISLEGQYGKMSRVYRNVMTMTSPLRPNATEDDKTFLDHLVKVIEDSCEQGEFTVEKIAEQMHTNPQNLRRRLADCLSVTPQVYFLQVRMQKARRLLYDNKELPVSEVAEKCGYTQITNFTRAFTRFYGITPSDMRAQAEIENKTNQQNIV